MKLTVKTLKGSTATTKASSSTTENTHSFMAPPKPHKILMVAEKPSSALSIASTLSDGHMSTRRSSIEVHEFNGTFRGSNAQYKATSVIDMFFSVDFPAKYQDWTIVDPLDFFQAPIHKAESNPKAHICRRLSQEARVCGHLVLWLDCDREGDNICFEVVECTGFHRPRSGTDAGDHPPIIPMRAVNEDMLVNDA